MQSEEKQLGVCRAQPSDLAAVIESCNRFAFELHSKLAGKPGNLFYSPSSISMALAMTFAGAAGQTATEMANVLHATLPEGQFHEGFRELRESTRTGSVELKLANRLWGQVGYHFLTEFLEATERYYGSRLAEVDFRNAAEEARLQINAWVAEQTADKISDLIPVGFLPPLTRLVLTNAIYFKGAWENEFDESDTAEAPFWTAPNTSQSVPMMRRTEYLRYGEFDGLQVLEMPYLSYANKWQPLESSEGIDVMAQNPKGGSELAMCILLPRRIDGLQEIETQLATSTNRDWTSLRTSRVDVSFPKFRIESGFWLDESLQSLGMRQAFSVEEADFSRMSNDPAGLHIAAVIHQAFVDINEKGTEAAAATAIVMRAGCAVEPDQPMIFRADHPFLFLIRDRKTRLIHFIGRVTNPGIQS
jgi:serpin B